MGYKERLREYRAKSDAIYARIKLERSAKKSYCLTWLEDHSLKTAEAIFRARFGPERNIDNAMIWRQLMIEQNRRAQNTKNEYDWDLFRLIQKQFQVKRDATKAAQEKLRKFQLECRTLDYGDDGQTGQGVSASDPRGVPGSG